MKIKNTSRDVPLLSITLYHFLHQKQSLHRGTKQLHLREKGQVSLFAAQEIVTSSTTTDFQMCHLSYNLSYWSKALPEKKKEKNHNWSFYLFHYFLPQALSTKSKCLFESRKRESSSGPGCSGLRDRLRWIRSKWVLCFCVNKRLYGFEVINHKILLCS